MIEILIALFVLGTCVTALIGGMGVVSEATAEAQFAQRGAFVAERELELAKADLLAGRLAPGPRGLPGRFPLPAPWRSRVLVGAREADGAVRLAVRCAGPASRSLLLESFLYVPLTSTGTVTP